MVDDETDNEMVDNSSHNPPSHSPSHYLPSQSSICLAHPSHPFSNFDRFVVYTCEMRWDGRLWDVMRWYEMMIDVRFWDKIVKYLISSFTISTLSLSSLLFYQAVSCLLFSWPLWWKPSLMWDEMRKWDYKRWWLIMRQIISQSTISSSTISSHSSQ